MDGLASGYALSGIHAMLANEVMYDCIVKRLSDIRWLLYLFHQCDIIQYQ